jgi:hypothetical protein
MPKLDFSGPSETAFEEFTLHLLSRLNFVNVDWRNNKEIKEELEMIRPLFAPFEYEWQSCVDNL